MTSQCEYAATASASASAEGAEEAALLPSPDSSASSGGVGTSIPACAAGFRAHARVALCALLAGAALGWCATSLPLPWRWHWQEPNRDTETDARQYFAPPSTVIAGDDDGIGGGGDAVAPAVSAESTESAGGEPKKEGGDQLPEGGATNANTAQGRGGTLLHPQCIDGSALMKEEEEEDRNRPLLILKYARTGST